MRNWLSLFEDSAAARVISFDDLHKHFKSKYGIDLYDVNGKANHGMDAWLERNGIQRAPDIRGQQEQFQQYMNAPDGDRAEPAYFNFWHWLLEQSRSIPFTTTDDQHWKVFPLALAEVKAPTEEDLEAHAAIMNAQKAMGGAAMTPPSNGYNEAPGILEKIFRDFGPDVEILMDVSR